MMPSTSRTGFSVTELLIAVSLIAILAAIALPSFASYTTPFRVQTAGREVYSALQEVRQQAITRGSRTRFQVTGENSYTLLWDDRGTWRTIRGPILVDSGVRLVSSGGDLTFQPRGTVSPATTMTVTDVRTGAHELAISVPITGLIRMRSSGR